MPGQACWLLSSPACCLHMKGQLRTESAARAKWRRGQGTQCSSRPLSSSMKITLHPSRRSICSLVRALVTETYTEKPIPMEILSLIFFGLKCMLLQRQVTFLYWWNTLKISFTVCCCHAWPSESCSLPLLPKGKPQDPTEKSEWSINAKIGQLANNDKLLCSSHNKDASPVRSLCLETKDGNPAHN